MTKITTVSKNNNALVLLSGGIAGAVGAGFVHTLCKESALEEFSAIYCYSVGVYAGTFGVAGQFETIEEVWRNHVHGRRLINPFNLFTFGLLPTLKLGYLESLFSEKFKVNVDAISSSSIDLKYVLMDYYSGEVRFETPTKENVLDLMSGASAIPFLYGAKEVQGKKYLDPTFIYDMAPHIQSIVSKHDRIVVVKNFPKNYVDYKHSKVLDGIESFFYPIVARFHPLILQENFKMRRRAKIEKNKYLESEEKIELLQPEILPLKDAGDTDKRRINETFDEGVKLALKYLGR